MQKNLETQRTHEIDLQVHGLQEIHNISIIKKKYDYENDYIVVLPCRKNWRIVTYFLSLCIFNIHFTSVLFIPENKCFRLGGTSPHSGHVIWYKATSPLSINLQWWHGLDIIIADLKVDRRLMREDLFFSLWPPLFAFVSSKYA